MVRMTKAEKLARVKYLRDAAVDLVDKEGVWKPVGVRGEEIRVEGIDRGTLSILYTTPFQKLPWNISDREKYIAAIDDIKVPERPAFMIDVWGRKVLSVHWNDEVTTDVISYHRGNWESQLEA
jgi:hypothetical protein